MRNRESWTAAFPTDPIWSTATRLIPLEPVRTRDDVDKKLGQYDRRLNSANH